MVVYVGFDLDLCSNVQMRTVELTLEFGNFWLSLNFKCSLKTVKKGIGREIRNRTISDTCRPIRTNFFLFCFD